MEILVSVGLAILATLSIVLLWRLTLDSYRKWAEANRRAKELLRSVLTNEQYCQLTLNGYLGIKSPRDQERTYRVPRGPGLVRVLERGRHTASLCLQPLEQVPDADYVVMHKLMIEADEEAYLQTANTFAAPSMGRWGD